MNKRNVWKIVPIMELPNGRKPIGNKWVLKIKRDGRYQARLVCLGFTQIPGIDFQDNFSNTKRVLVLDWLPQYNQIQLHQLNLMMRGITRIKNNANYGEMPFKKN